MSKLARISCLVFYILVLSTGFAKGQIIDCSYDEQVSLLNDPSSTFYKSSQEYELNYQKYLKTGLTQTRKSTMYDNLPIVFHIVHQGDSLGSRSNPRDEVLREALEFTNNIFRQTNSELKFENPNYGADTGISFCIASRDEKGNPSPGILRYKAPENNPFFLAGFLWDKSKFINVIIKDLSGVCGVYFPNQDEIHISNNCLVGSSSMAHELGHYLSLQHTFKETDECDNVACTSMGDFVCDTPPQFSGDLLAQNGFEDQPCSHPGNSCQSDEQDTSEQNPYRSVDIGGLGDQPDANNNIMGYGGICRTNFTHGQAARMQFNLLHERELLWSQMSHCDDFVSINDAGISKINISSLDDCGDENIMEVYLKNFGSSTLTEVDILAYKDNEQFDILHWTGSLLPEAYEVVIFEGVEIEIGENKFQAHTANPNAVQDDNINSDFNYINHYFLATDQNLIGLNKTLCGEDTVEIGIELPNAQENLHFFWRRENGIMSTESIYDSIINVSTPDLYSLTYYTEDYSCVWKEDYNITQISDQADKFNILNEFPFITCSGYGLLLRTTVSESNTKWYTRDGFFKSTSSPYLSIDSAGEYRVKGVDFDSGCEVFGDWFEVLDTRNSPEVNLSVDGEITCQNNEVLISAIHVNNSFDSFTYNWSGSGMNRITDTLPYLKVSHPGVYSLEAVNSFTGCKARVSVEVFSDINVPIVKIYRPITGFIDSLRLNAMESSQGENYEFKWTAVRGQILSDENTYSPIVKALGIYRLDIENTLTGCKKSKEITLMPRHTFDIVPRCSAGEPYVDLTIRIVDVDLFSEKEVDPVWVYPDGNEVASNSLNVENSGVYKVIYFNGLDTITDEVLIIPEMLEVPNADISIIDSLDCIGQASLLSGENSEFNDFCLIVWKDENNSALDVGISTLVSQEGIYSFEIYNRLNSCRDIFSQNIDLPQEFVVADAGEDALLTCKQKNVEVGRNEENENYKYKWNLISNMDTVFIGDSPRVQVDKEGIYQLEMYNSINDCYSYDDVKVQTVTDIFDISIQSELVNESCNTTVEVVLYPMNIENYYAYDLYWILPDGKRVDDHYLHVSQSGEYILYIESLLSDCAYTESYKFNSEQKDPLKIEDFTSTAENLIVLPAGGVPPYLFLWEDGGEINKFINPTLGEAYFVTITDDIGCTVIGSGTFLPVSQDENLFVFPNPATNEIQIYLNGRIISGDLEIYNSAGISVLSSEDYSINGSIEINSLSAGVYFVVLKNDSESLHAKFVKI